MMPVSHSTSRAPTPPPRSAGLSSGGASSAKTDDAKRAQFKDEMQRIAKKYCAGTVATLSRQLYTGKQAGGRITKISGGGPLGGEEAKRIRDRIKALFQEDVKIESFDATQEFKKWKQAATQRKRQSERAASKDRHSVTKAVQAHIGKEPGQKSQCEFAAGIERSESLFSLKLRRKGEARFDARDLEKMLEKGLLREGTICTHPDTGIREMVGHPEWVDPEPLHPYSPAASSGSISPRGRPEGGWTSPLQPGMAAPAPGHEIPFGAPLGNQGIPNPSPGPTVVSRADVADERPFKRRHLDLNSSASGSAAGPAFFEQPPHWEVDAAWDAQRFPGYATHSLAERPNPPPGAGPNAAGAFGRVAPQSLQPLRPPPQGRAAPVPIDPALTESRPVSHPAPETSSALQDPGNAVSSRRSPTPEWMRVFTKNN